MKDWLDITVNPPEMEKGKTNTADDNYLCKNDTGGQLIGMIHRSEYAYPHTYNCYNHRGECIRNVKMYRVYNGKLI